MNITDLVYFLIFDAAIFLALLLINFHSWFQILRPDLYKKFRILENNFMNEKEKLFFLPLDGNKEEYNIDKFVYNHKGIRPILSSTGVYTWSFEYGKTNALTISPNQQSLDGNLMKELRNYSMDSIWFGDKSFEDFLKTYGVLFIGIILMKLSQNLS